MKVRGLISNEILYFSAVLIGLFDQTCVDAVISIIYQDSLLGNIVCTIQENLSANQIDQTCLNKYNWA